MSTWSSPRTRPVAAQRPFIAWQVAVLAYLLGTAVLLGLGFVLGLAGLVIAFGMGLSGTGDSLTRDDFAAAVITVAVGLGILSVAVQSRFIRRRGGARPVAAPVTAIVASLLIGLAVSPFGLPTLPLVVLQALVEIGVMAKMIEPGRR